MSIAKFKSWSIQYFPHFSLHSPGSEAGDKGSQAVCLFERVHREENYRLRSKLEKKGKQIQRNMFSPLIRITDACF